MNFETDPDLEQPSKTRLKQEATELQELGRRLTSCSPAVLQELPLSEVLISAIAEFNRLPNSHGARRRQLQFIGKLMREIDYDAVVDAMQDLENRHLKKQKKPAEAKLLCDRILELGDAEIHSALQQYPQLERQTLRQLYLEYQRADEAGKGRFGSKLLKYLQQQIDS